MRHLTLIFALMLAVSSTGCTVQYVNPFDCIVDPYGACVGDCNNYGGLPSPAEYRRQRRFYRDLNRLQRKYPNLAACVGIGGCSACDMSCGGPVMDSCCGPTFDSCTTCGPSYADSGCSGSCGAPMSVGPSCGVPMSSEPYYSSPAPAPLPAPTPVPHRAPTPVESSQYLAPPLPSFPNQSAQMISPPPVSNSPRFASPVVATPPVVTNSPVVTSSQIISSTPSYSQGPALPAPSGIQQAGWTTGPAF